VRADRSAGAHPYLVTPEHTRRARETLGADPVLAPEHKAVLDTDPGRARELARARVENPYLHLSNYTTNLKRLGWSDEDVAAPGSDALIDALVAHGTDAEVAARLQEHLAAGADHVAVQLLVPSDGDVFDGYRRLASALGL
jgi:probable F420-dependent oxidoreductase